MATKTKATTLTTRELKPSKHEDRRVKVAGGGDILVMKYDLEKSRTENHAEAAARLARRLRIADREPQSCEEAYGGAGFRYVL